MNYILGIQTAEYPNSVCVIKQDGEIVASTEIDKRERTVELLKSTIELILDKADIKVDDISLVSVCLGPGSYTGLRGGLAFAKGMCQFSKVPLVGVDAFDVLKQNVKNARDTIYMLDARNERVYLIKADDKQIKTDLVANVIAGVNKKTLFVGSGAIVNKELIKSKLKEKATFVSRDANQLKARDVARVGLSKYKNNRSIFTKQYLYKVKPLYILPPNVTKPQKELAIC